jgi:hypothetical protein
MKMSLMENERQRKLRAQNLSQIKKETKSLGTRLPLKRSRKREDHLM